MTVMSEVLSLNSKYSRNLAISNSVNSKSPLFRRKIECPWIYPSSVISKPRYFELFSISLGTSKWRGSTVY